MTTLKFTALAFTAIGLVSVWSSAASYAATRDHRNTAGKPYTSRCHGPNFACPATSQGGVVVTQGKHRQYVVPTKVTPAGGSFGGKVTDHRTKR